MSLQDVVRALRTRLALIGVLALVGLALAAGLAALKTPQYSATATINLTAPSSGIDSTGQTAALSKVPTIIEIIGSQNYLATIISGLKLDTTPEDLQDDVDVTGTAGTSVLDISVTTSSASRSTAIANAVADGVDDYLGEVKQSAVRAQLISRATEPGGPSSPDLLLWLVIGGVIGLALGTGYALSREALDRSVREPEELTEHLGLAVLGAIPFDPSARRQPLAVAARETNPRAEALRQLRTNLQFLHLDEDSEAPRSILFTSAVAGEGKTTTACNVAIALARAGLQTVLVGADLRRTELTSHMRIAKEVGLTSVLAGWADLDDALQEWGDGSDGLLVLGAGPLPPNPSELLASEQMQELLRELEKRVDIVILDGAPLLPVADSAAVAAITSGTVLVVGAGSTTRDQIARALAILNGIDAEIFGGVLNLVTTGRLAKEGSGYL